MSANDMIDARPETVGSLLTFSSTPSPVEVPVYQRFYQWDKSKVIDLLKLTDPDSRDFGFIGTMVFVQNKNGNLEVVDGQQRLLSLILLLCAIRDYIGEYLGSVQTDEVRTMLTDMQRDIQTENLLVMKSYSSVQDNPRIVFNRSTYETFKRVYLVGEAEYRSDDIVPRTELKHFQGNYFEARDYLHKKYDDKKEKDVVKFLNRRLEKLKSLVINAIYISDPMNAGEVFESINGTGVTLKLSELVKNFVFRSINTNTVITRWEEIEQNSGNNATIIENIIKYDWQNKNDVSDDFEIFRSIKTNVSDVNAYLDRIVRVSRIFKFYLHPGEENFRHLKLEDNRNDKQHLIKLASTLRTIGVKQFLRTIIALDPLGAHIGLVDHLKLVGLIHNFQVRAKVSSAATNEMDRIYSKYGKRLNKLAEDINERQIVGGKLIKSLLHDMLFVDLKADLTKVSTNDVFKSSFITFSRTKSTGKDFFKYLLASIENKLQKSELSIDVRDNQITLEEIYPQEPAKEWASVSDMGSDAIYRFANATILKGKDNGAGSNKTIGEKYPIYTNSNLLINDNLVEIIDSNDGAWNVAALEQRARFMAEIAQELWKI